MNSRRRLSGQVHSDRFIPGKEHHLSTGCIAGWASELLWTKRQRGKSLPPSGIIFTSSSLKLFTLLTELSRKDYIMTEIKSSAESLASTFTTSSKLP
jgi:hypothetical protein